MNQQFIPVDLLSQFKHEMVSHGYGSFYSFDTFENGNLKENSTKTLLVGWRVGHAERVKLKAEVGKLQAEVERLKSEPVKAVTLTCAELQEAYYLGCPDETPDQEQTEMYIKWLDDGHSGAGYYCWVSECAEEGCIKLGEVREQANDS